MLGWPDLTEEELVAREQFGFAGPLRYYTLLVNLGFDWAEPVRASMEIKHREAMREFWRIVAERRKAQEKP